jgi:heat-inducible transcriptional repressor
MSLIGSRKLRVLEAVVLEYLISAEPVGSSRLVEKYRLNVSSATIRNDMAELTECGLLEQPHTSAGRRPTEEGYRIYVDEFVGEGLSPTQELMQQIEIITAELLREREVAVRDFARYLSHLTGESVFVSLGDSVSITGTSNLFKKPEFRAADVLNDFFLMFDQIDDLAQTIRPRLKKGVTVYIGEDNPFCPHLSSIVTRWDSEDGLIGIIGPTRMDYELNVGIMRSVRNLLMK